MPSLSFGFLQGFSFWYTGHLCWHYQQASWNEARLNITPRHWNRHCSTVQPCVRRLWELSCTQAALGVFNISAQHHAETPERAPGSDWARWASGSSDTQPVTPFLWGAVRGHLSTCLATSPTHKATCTHRQLTCIAPGRLDTPLFWQECQKDHINPSFCLWPSAHLQAHHWGYSGLRQQQWPGTVTPLQQRGKVLTPSMQSPGTFGTSGQTQAPHSGFCSTWSTAQEDSTQNCLASLPGLACTEHQVRWHTYIRNIFRMHTGTQCFTLSMNHTLQPVCACQETEILSLHS